MCQYRLLSNLLKHVSLINLHYPLSVKLLHLSNPETCCSLIALNVNLEYIHVSDSRCIL